MQTRANARRLTTLRGPGKVKANDKNLLTVRRCCLTRAAFCCSGPCPDCKTRGYRYAGAVLASIPSGPNASATSAPTPSTNTEPSEKQTGRERQPNAKKLEKYDTNKNGVIDTEERIAMRKDKLARHEARLKKYDKNGDGKLDDTVKAAMRAEEKAEKKADKVQ